jgi:hypothetical protein
MIGEADLELTLHEWYTVDEAVAAFGSGARSESFCDGQFIVLPTVVLCFAMVGEGEEKPHVSCPSCFVWRPAHPSNNPMDEKAWLPGKICDSPLPRYMFLRSSNDERYFYAGRAHLGSYGDCGGVGMSANFTLRERLPRDIWLKFGGYPGWLVDVNHGAHRVDKTDFPAFERLVNELPHQEFSHLWMTRYEEDSLTVHTNARRGWLMYERDPDDVVLYTRDLEYGDDPGSEEVFRCACGISLEFAASQTLPRKLALQATIEFFNTGQLPQCVPWE